MQKIIYSLLLPFALLSFNHITYAQQSTFTADLAIFKADSHTIELKYNDSADIHFYITNLGFDNIDTSNFIVFGMNGIPPNYYLIAQNENGLIPLNYGDTVRSFGVRFSNNQILEEDDIVDYCYFLRNNEYEDHFIFDPNQDNDTLCFTIIYKKGNDVGVNQLSFDETIHLNPNPASQFINIPLIQHQPATIKIYSIEGRILAQENIAATPQSSYQYNTSTFHPGMYVLHLEQEGKLKRSKFIISK